MSGAAPTEPDTATVEALRRLKAAEADGEAQLRQAQEAAAQAIQRARDEAEATVKAVAAELETERTRALEAASAAADREAEQIRADGAKAADALRTDRSKRPADRADAIVATVLGPFASD